MIQDIKLDGNTAFRVTHAQSGLTFWINADGTLDLCGVSIKYAKLSGGKYRTLKNVCHGIACEALR
jgi:hypothetical protein